MLLFKLPWLCHGVKLNLSAKPNASMTDEISSQQSISMRSGSDAGINALILACRDNQYSQVDHNKGSCVKSTNPFTKTQLQALLEGAKYGPASIHGHQFELYSKVCFGVFPIQLHQVNKVVNHIFGHLAQFQ
jgi:hypothetical protein